jgi:hypothetical protein
VNRGRHLPERRIQPLALAAALLGLFASVSRAALFDPPEPPGGHVEPLFVDPIAPGMAPVALPPFTPVPGGTVPVIPPLPGEFPVDIPPLTESANRLSIDAMTELAAGYSNFDPAVASTPGSDSFAVHVLVREEQKFTSYGVSETASNVSVSCAARDGVRSELVASGELTGPLDGGLVWVKFENNLVTQLKVVTQNSTDATIWDYPGGASPPPGLSNAAQIAALNGLVDAHLTGPARNLGLASYDVALARYFALTIPETGNFNQDNSFDAADFVAWRKGFGTTYTTTGYNEWRSHFGQPAGSGALSHDATIPEPATVVMLLAGIGTMLFRRRAGRVVK